MTTHVHQCLDCTPEMVPDYDKADVRYHGADKCVPGYAHGVALVDGKPVSYTCGIFTGREGWALFVGKTIDDIHWCTCGSKAFCSTPVFGKVEVVCPS